MSNRQWSAYRNTPDRTDLLRKTLTLDLTSLKITYVNVNDLNGIFEVKRSSLLEPMESRSVTIPSSLDVGTATIWAEIQPT